MSPLLIGTRKSPLALIQTQLAIDQLNLINSTLEKKVVPIVTMGDKIQDRPLTEIGGKELFIKEIHQHLLQETIHIGVHSLKDIPGYHHDDIVIAAMLERENAHDILVSRDNMAFTDLPKGSIIGSSSPRRQSQLLELRPDLTIISVRGRVQTRIKLVEEGKVDAVILAYAGVKRVSLDHLISHTFSTDDILPAVGQGIIAIDCLKKNGDLVSILNQINHWETYICGIAERSFLQEIKGTCHTPLAAYARITNKRLTLKTYYYLEEKKPLRMEDYVNLPSLPEEQLKAALLLGKELGERTLKEVA